MLHVAPRDFSEGFPGVADRFEWFALDYNGRFWIRDPGRNEFYLLSDDGSRLLFDGKTVINSDNQNATRTRDRGGSVTLKTGIHRIRVNHFQGAALPRCLDARCKPCR